jgi:hypothetical protein
VGSSEHRVAAMGSRHCWAFPACGGGGNRRVRWARSPRRGESAARLSAPVLVVKSKDRRAGSAWLPGNWRVIGDHR